MAIALRSALGLLQIPFSFWTIIIGHATFCMVIVYNNVLARFRRMGPSQMEASMDLGAHSFQTFRHIVLPHLATALVAGRVGACALPRTSPAHWRSRPRLQETLPIWMFN